MKPIIKVENLSKRFSINKRQDSFPSLRERLSEALRSPIKQARAKREVASETIWALRDICFEVNPGEVLGIIGRNGAGKSTLLKVLSRITEPTTGRIELYGRLGSLLEVGTGFHPELSGRENVFLNGAILGMRTKEIKSKFDEIVEFAEIEKFIDTPVKRYSSGMYMRLAFAVAAHLEPEILLVDEVLAVGDATFQKKCLGKMENVAEQGRTVLFVSHQMAAIQNLCQRLILIKAGRVFAIGKTDEVLNQYFNETTALSQISLAERRDRQGTGDVRFTSLTLYNGNHERINSLRSGESSTLSLQYENRKNLDLRNLHLSIGIDNHAGQRVSVLSNELTGEIFQSIPSSSNTIEIQIDRLPLIPGRYGFTLYCTVNGVVADWIQNAGFFDVDSGDYYNTGKLPPAAQGSFLIDHKFQLPQTN